MQLDVYQTDAEAFEAAAERVAAVLGGGKEGRLTIALSGGRGGRGVMIALAARSDLPWDRLEWFWGDERCVPVDDVRSNVRLARETLLRPRGVLEARIHPPPLDLEDPERIAAAYGETLRTLLAPGPAPVFDVVLLGVGKNGHLGSLMPGSAALHASGPVATIPVEAVAEEPRVARITVTPAVLRAARHVIVTVAGDAKAGIVGRVLQERADPDQLPAQLFPPGPHVEWIVDRAAAAVLLRDARPAQ